MNIELRHLRAFLAVAEHGTITAAAARLHVGQPALSRTLRQLEQHLGVRLVDRSTHHLELTEAGRRYRTRVASALDGVDAVLGTGWVESWPLRLGYAWSAVGDHTAALLRRWELANPTVPLRLVQVESRGAGLTEGLVDVALLRGDVQLAGVRTEFLLEEARVAVVPADGPLARRAELSLADLAGQVVAINEQSGTTTARLWPDGARPRTTAVSDTQDWLVAIASGRAVGVSSEATALMHAFPGVAYLPLRDAPPLSVVLAWNDPPSHPSVPELVRLAHEVVERPVGRTG